MAAVTPQVSKLSGHNKNCHKILWETLTSTNTTGTGVRIPGSADKSVQAVGNFSGTAVFNIEGSNDSTNGTDGTWVALLDPQGNTIALNVTGEMEQILENPAWIRAKLASGGDGSTDVDITIITKK